MDATFWLKEMSQNRHPLCFYLVVLSVLAVKGVTFFSLLFQGLPGVFSKGWPWMLRKLPGIDIPIATEAKILHAAAFLEFKHHVERLLRERHDTAAYTCWMHAVEVGHSPFVLPTTTEVQVLPPLPKMPCCQPECQRCAAHSGGFKFPWLGLWNSRGVIIPPDVAPDEAWEYYYNHSERMDLIFLSAYSSVCVVILTNPRQTWGEQVKRWPVGSVWKKKAQRKYRDFMRSLWDVYMHRVWQAWVCIDHL